MEVSGQRHAPAALEKGKGGRGVRPTTQLLLLPRLRKRRAMPPLLQYVFMTYCLIKQRIRVNGVVFRLAQGQLYFHPGHHPVSYIVLQHVASYVTVTCRW